MKIRRLVSLMMALILAIALAVPASAAELTYDVPGGKLYFDAATGTITRSDDTITEADIPAEINGIPVTAIGSAAFAQPCNDSGHSNHHWEKRFLWVQKSYRNCYPGQCHLH